MQNFTFITDTDGSSGKVASDRTRTAIRAHVMRKHWIDNPNSGKKKLGKTISRPQQGTSGMCLSSSPSEATAVGDGAVSASGPRLISPVHAHSDENRISRHLSRVTDGFVYAGSSIDSRSYGLVHHYSLECTFYSNASYRADMLTATKSVLSFQTQSTHYP